MVSITFKKGNSYFYKNQFMEDAIKLKLVHKQEWTGGEIESLEFKKADGSIITLKKQDVKYLATSEELIDGNAFEKKFNAFICEEIKECPKQLFGLVQSFNKKEVKGTSPMTFIEEVKDGRERKFNMDSPLKLMGKDFTYKAITLKIKAVEYLGVNSQPSDYNEYIESNYSISYTIQYSHKDAAIEASAHKLNKNYKNDAENALKN